MKLGMQVGLGPGHIVLDGVPAPAPPKGHSPPIFGPYMLWSNGIWIKIRLGREVGLGPSDIVLDWDPVPPAQKGAGPKTGGNRPKTGGAENWGLCPQFSAHVYSCKTAGWIKMALGMEVSLGPGHIVLDGDPAPPSQKGGHSPSIFGPCLCGQTAGWVKIPLRTKVGLGPGHIVLQGDPASSQKGHSSFPQFSAHGYCVQTVAHLSYCWALVL